jgi:hypothetical protein
MRGLEVRSSTIGQVWNLLHGIPDARRWAGDLVMAVRGPLIGDIETDLSMWNGRLVAVPETPGQAGIATGTRAPPTRSRASVSNAGGYPAHHPG